MIKKFKPFYICGYIVLALSTFSICGIYKNNVQADKINEAVYTVKEGDCLSLIAENYKRDSERTESVIAKIKFRNNKVTDMIMPGEKLYIPME